MNQKEKSLQSREHILQAAVAEFGAKGYGGASLNNLLAENGISKGQIYHHFKDKDQLYLACAGACFQTLTGRLSAYPPTENPIAALQRYFEIRSSFFAEYPSYGRIFFEALLQPPAHLKQELHEICAGLETVNQAIFRAVLNHVDLRDGVSEQDALAYFTLVQNVFHMQALRMLASSPERVSIGFYEQQARKNVEFMLFGLVKRGEE